MKNSAVNLPVLGIGMAILAAMLWGTTGTAQSMASGSTSPYWTGALRLAFSCGFFLILIFYKRFRQPPYSADVCAQRPTPLKQKPYLATVLIAGTRMGLYNLSFFSGVKATGIAIGTAAAIGSAPIWAGLLQALITRKAPPWLWWAGTLCATAGGIWMVLSQATPWQFDPKGLALCLSAGLTYAIYTLVSKRLLKMASPLTITSHTFGIAALIAIPAAWLLTGPLSITSSDWLIMLYLGVAATGISYLLFTQALKHISAATGVALALFEPITAFVLAIVVVGEPVQVWAFAGLCLILAGLVLVLRTEMRAATV